MAIGRRGPGEKVDSELVVKFIHLQPASRNRQIPAQDVDKNTLPILVHLHQRRCVFEPVFGEEMSIMIQTHRLSD